MKWRVKRFMNEWLKRKTLYKTTYGLYQYRIISIHIGIILIMNEWNEYYIPYISTWKRYNHFNTTIYHTGQERGYKTLSTYFNSTTMHHITLPQDERTTANNIFIPERPQPIKCRTIYHRWNYTTIQNHFNITGHYITR